MSINISKKINNLPKGQIKKLFAKAKKFFIVCGYPEYISDDFAQFYVIKICQGRRASINHILIDFLRHEFGENVRGGQSGLKKSEVNLGKVRACLERVSSHQYLEEKIMLPDEFSERERWILERLDAGYNQREIGDYLGITESRVSQIMVRAERILRSKHDGYEGFL